MPIDSIYTNQTQSNTNTNTTPMAASPIMDDEMTKMLMARLAKSKIPRGMPHLEEDSVSPLEAQMFAAGIVITLREPLKLFARKCLEVENCKHLRIGVPPGVKPMYYRFFMLNGRSGFPFTMNSRLFNKEGRSMSFLDLCFGPKKSGSDKYSERDTEQAWFNQLGLGFKASPFFQLARLIYKDFLEIKCQMVLTMKILDIRPPQDGKVFAEGQSLLEFMHSADLYETLEHPSSNWLEISKADSSFSASCGEHDGLIEETLARTEVLEFLSHHSCTNDLYLKNHIQILQEEILECQKKLREHLETHSPIVYKANRPRAEARENKGPKPKAKSTAAASLLSAASLDEYPAL